MPSPGQPPTIFVSFAGERRPWIDSFLRDEWFRVPVGNAILDRYSDHPIGVGPIEEGLLKRIRACDCFLVFLSAEYIDKQYPKFEFETALREFAPGVAGEKRAFAAVLLDATARNWWNEQSETQAGAWLKGWSFLDMIGPSGRHPHDVIGETGPISRVTHTILDFAKQIRAAMAGTAPAPRRRLPPLALPPVPICIGRSPDIDAVVQGITSDERATIVLGGPGIGKSTVALKAMHSEAVAARFSGRRYFVRCDDAPEPDAILYRLAEALRILQPTLRPSIAEALGQGEPTLVLLDGIETAWERQPGETEDMLAWLASVKSVTLLVCMRGNERPGRVRWCKWVGLKPLERRPSRELFLSVAGPHFASDPLLPTLLSKLEGLPLAIELMAHAAQAEPDLKGVWQRWQDERARMLERSPGAIDDPRLSAKVSFEASIHAKRMDDEARALLSILSCLPVGLASRDLHLLPYGVRGAMKLRRVGLAFDETSRLRVLAPLRAYVSDIYPPSDDDLRRVVEHYVAMMSRLALTLTCGQGGKDIRALAPEAPNTGALLRTQLARATLPDELGRALVILANCSGNYLFLSGLNKIGKRYLDDALRLAQRLQDDDAEATTHLNLGRLEEKLGHYAVAERHLNACVSPAGNRDDYLRRAAAYHILGIIAFNRCRYAKAMDILKSGLKHLDMMPEEAAGHDDVECIRCDLLERMCITALMQGKIGAARTFGEDGLALARDLDDDFRISVHCKNMCWLESEIRNFTDAEAHGMEGLRHAQRIGHRGELAGLLYHLGMLAAAQADLKLARSRLRQGLRYALEANHRWYTAAIWNGWSEIHLGQAGYAAKNRFPAAPDLAIAIASPCMEARSLFGWARLAFLQGDPVAWERGSESLIIYEKHRLTAQAKKVRTWLKEAFPPPSDGASAPPAFQISTTPRRPPRTGM